MKKSSRFLKIFIFFLSFLLFFVCLTNFVSCSNESSQKSFVSSLDEIDILINQHQYKEAVSKLKKIEKKAFNPLSHIGIFRRYQNLGEDELAQKILEKALKKTPENLDLIALYSNFLYKKGDFENALKNAEPLKGTEFGSIYSEIFLNEILRTSQNQNLETLFNNLDFYNIYLDAYTGSKNNAWLRNCALLNLARGNYEKASEIYPEEIFESEDAYFWALVMYDSKRYGDAVNFCNASNKFLQLNSAIFNNNQSEYFKILNLLSDSYTALKDQENAQKIRQDFINSLKKDSNSVYENWILPKEFMNESSLIFTNSAHYAFDNQNYDEAAKYLNFIVNTWPNNVYGLVLYSDFAWQSNLPNKQNSIQMQLKDSGVASLQMEEFDNRAKIPVSDAIYRVKNALEITKDPYLYILDLDLRYKTNNNLTLKQKTTDLWNLLEQNAILPGVYQDVLLDYVVNFLIKNKLNDDAFTLFKGQIQKKYEFDETLNFWNSCFEKKDLMSLKELEYISYFATYFLRSQDSLRFYEAICFEDDISVLNKKVSDSAIINLALVYNSLGKKDEALKLYSKAISRTPNLNTKSLISYRIALIYYFEGEYKISKKNALYALNLNNNNEKARLLLNQIKVKEK